MVTGTHWVSNGAPAPAPPVGENGTVNERELLHRRGYVKIVQDGNGTAVKWAMFTANWASLYFAIEWIHSCPAPYHLYYHSAGWFHEKYLTSAEASERISQLVYKSDIHLSRTVYIYDANENRDDVPVLLKAALQHNEADEEHSVDCLYDASSRKFRVSRVGAQSAIAKLWGMSPVSYPCLNGHSYDEAVSKVYPEVTRTGDPHYDHIYAAMMSPTGEVHWLPYQRVVIPLRTMRNKKGVRVVTEQAKVDISPL